MLSLEDAKDLLYKDIETNRVSHAYMISSNADNKELLGLVQQFVKKLLNTENLHASPDYRYIDKKEGKKDLAVEQIREELVEGIYIAPVSSDYRVYVVNDAGSMNAASQNAILKTLEEPPKYVVILLIKKISDILLPTITSRVKEVVIDTSNEIDIKEYMVDKYKVELNEKMIQYAKYSYEKADELAEEKNYQMFLAAEKLSNMVGKNNSVDMILMLDKISIKDGLFLDYLENILYLDGNISKIMYIERAVQRIKQNGNEEIIKAKIAIELAK